MRPMLCIVLPVLDEGATLAVRLQALEGLRRQGARIVVVDGGSQDDTLAVARERADLALLAPRGRASQMNAGAAACPADVLLFLHADTVLPMTCQRCLRPVDQAVRVDRSFRFVADEATAVALDAELDDADVLVADCRVAALVAPAALKSGDWAAITARAKQFVAAAAAVK